jgi:hypothetical protein
MGKFPTMKTVLDKVSRGAESMAFSRDFAVTHTGILKFKSLFDIGKVNMENGAALIDDGFSWVKEAYDETLENVA